MDRARRNTRLTLAALGTVIAAAIAIAVVAIAAAGGGEDVRVTAARPVPDALGAPPAVPPRLADRPLFALDPSLPDLPVRLLAPVSGHSATELFTRTVTGTEGRLLADLRVVRDTPDFGRILSRRPAALGIYGVGLVDVEDVVLDTVAVDAGEGCFQPRPPAVRAGRYPLAEPLYAYMTRSALRREPVARYFRTLVRRAPELADYPGIVPPAATRQVAQ
jgi:hypothetical protein